MTGSHPRSMERYLANPVRTQADIFPAKTRTSELQFSPGKKMTTPRARIRLCYMRCNIIVRLYLNHHIRNALTIIEMVEGYVDETGRRLEMVKIASTRIRRCVGKISREEHCEIQRTIS